MLDPGGAQVASAMVSVEPAGGGTRRSVPAGVPVRLDPGNYRVVGVTVGGTYTAVERAFIAPDYGMLTFSVQLPASAPPGGAQPPPGSSAPPPPADGQQPPTGSEGTGQQPPADTQQPTPAGSEQPSEGTGGALPSDQGGQAPVFPVSASPVPAAGASGAAAWRVGPRDLAASGAPGGVAEVDLTRRPEALSAPERRVQVDAAALSGLLREGRALRVVDRQAALTLPAEDLSLLASMLGGGELALSIGRAAAADPPAAERLEAAGTAVDLTVGRLAGGRVVSVAAVWPRPLELRLPFDPKALGERRTARLGVYRFDPASGGWEYVGGDVDRASGTVRARVAHLSVYGLFSADPRFPDLAGHWARDDVEVLAARRVVRGDAAGRFAPDRPVTRAEFAALLVRALGIPGSGRAAFADVSASAWYGGAVAAAAAAGVVRGDGARFRPEDPVTRQEAALMLARARDVGGAAPAGGVLSRFRDAGRVAPWAAAGVAAAVREGLMNGRGPGEFAPLARTTRAEAAALLKRLLSRSGRV